jgi:hypothetical protein
MSNFKSQAKRKRELAKLDKRNAKDQKRALRKAEKSGTEAGAPTAGVASVASPQPLPMKSAAPSAPPVRKPLTLAEAAERWKNTRIVQPKKR